MEILKLNEISPVADEAFKGKYTLTKTAKAPVGIILRSFNMHDYPLPPDVCCVGRAGAGVNNIPIDKCSESGVVVFNTPGANANAVKELAICALLLCGRKISEGINWASALKGADIPKQVESEKKAFVGKEIHGKTLGVIGLGAIGVLVANACIELGMNVVGYDPYISVDGAWNLNHHVVKETDLDKLFAESDFITLHVPLTDSTRSMINSKTIALMKDGAAIVNCSRGELVNNADVKAALKSGKLSKYATDFPSEEVVGVENIIAIPHLGASTPEAEDNCARMVARQMTDFIENGNITNSVNFPSCKLTRSGCQRITVIHKNVKNVLRSMTDLISGEGINISNFVSQSKGDYAYCILDLDEKLKDNVLEKLKNLENIVKVRLI